jgi:hypothetical protein
MLVSLIPGVYMGGGPGGLPPLRIFYLGAAPSTTFRLPAQSVTTFTLGAKP